ncbi:phage tail assembly chaperone G [Niallia sp. 03091]|uniref:phage tail assembly chaperone G n=1 Tax=Niallia sp. 03091 TaxID=3458059 RepID=UPI004044A02E
MLRIELRNKKGEKVVYEQEFVSAKRVRVALEMQVEFDNNPELTELEYTDKMVEFVAGTFTDKKLTTDDIWEGLESHIFYDELDRIFNQVMGKDKQKPKETAEEKQ